MLSSPGTRPEVFAYTIVAFSFFFLFPVYLKDFHISDIRLILQLSR